MRDGYTFYCDYCGSGFDDLEDVEFCEDQCAPWGPLDESYGVDL